MTGRPWSSDIFPFLPSRAEFIDGGGGAALARLGGQGFVSPQTHKRLIHFGAWDMRSPPPFVGTLAFSTRRRGCGM